ncbi:GAF domain-containing sensor histidine kinase [Anoxybacillus sp. LAT_35]|uniref:sensor histidine kinase n=1 Tax=unclassified Anoxybacillus TaxID=2639704 RepID=UPI001EEC84CB|nr:MULTISPECIES: GAF domain-containing sensor histidine kinase [unclassified Anoxybacillus]MCG6171362.1 GAF domain-containing sensor histidine kinase [Anoxybacillus sp. LAT_11]MCG6178896.1 GAF domain-containing sensor histidine kinase [Anoxybacillus sp. LAT_35]MCG6185580.1 GAF domain-containing sensor histidine kinase [Anoxybacillus sp. LAT_26]MCG6195713.1 GAF domain-containing sensor histidine kinase [Anoxybacillus sp. LAT_38]
MDRSLMAALESLRIALHVTRVAIFRLHTTDQTYILQRIYYIQTPSLHLLPRNELVLQTEQVHCLAHLYDGNVFVGHTDELDENVRTIFEEQSIQSFMIAPIFIHDERWGFLSVVDCERRRVFSAHERAIFWALARTIGESMKREQELTELQQLKQKMEQMNATLQQKIAEEVRKNREKDFMLIEQSRYATMGEMLRNIAHQWRQPLNVLGLLLQDIQEAYAYGELNEAYLRTSIQKCLIQIRHMSRTINDFRNFFHPHKEATYFRPIQAIRQALKIISASLDHYDIHLHVQNRTRARIYGYPNELSQVLINLLTNACEQFVARDVARRIICVRTYADDSFIYIQVKDNAGGIDETILPRIFEPYVTTKKNGTGLGLYMSNMIVTKMGGDLLVSSSNKGATFTIRMPRKEGEKER